MRHVGQLLRDRGGNFAISAALCATVLAVGIGASVDYHRALNQREKLQQALDAGLLAAMAKPNMADRSDVVSKVLAANTAQEQSLAADVESDFSTNLSLVQNSDGSVTARYHDEVDTTFMRIVGKQSMEVSVKSTAIATGEATAGPCIWSLASSGQDVLINSGASVSATDCRIDVHSTANPAFIMNGGSTIKFAKFCVKGKQYIKNGGTLTNLETDCAVQPDPYAGKLVEPALPASCTTSGTRDGANITLAPGMHCGTTFNGSPTVTFQPGLHIIKDRMIINSGATVIAKGVTFYFADTNSEIRANGGLTFTGTAPTSGAYKGVLMFEKTSDANNNKNKVQYIFNGSKGETLEGIIHLPNRNVVYNSTTNVAAKISMVVNQIIFNSANWQIEPFTGGGTTSGATMVRLLE